MYDSGYPASSCHLRTAPHWFPGGAATLVVLLMAMKAPTPCRHPGCGALVHGGSYCDLHLKVARARYERTQRNKAWQALYKSARWIKARISWLAKHPLCAEHEKRGEVVAATEVDHIVPHRGCTRLFWDSSNWQSLCKSCHSTKTARENGGFGNA